MANSGGISWQASSNAIARYAHCLGSRYISHGLLGRNGDTYTVRRDDAYGNIRSFGERSPTTAESTRSDSVKRRRDHCNKLSARKPYQQQDYAPGDHPWRGRPSGWKRVNRRGNGENPRGFATRQRLRVAV